MNLDKVLYITWDKELHNIDQEDMCFFWSSLLCVLLGVFLHIL